MMKLKIDKEEILYHIEELKKSRLFLAIVSLIIGLIVAFVLTPAFTEALKGKKEVVKIITDVKAGDRITEKMLTIVEVGGYNLDEEIATKKEEVVGQYAQMDIAKNTYVYKNYVSNISPLNNNYLKENLDGLKRAISFKVKSEAKPVAEKLQKNDIVTLIFTKVGSKNDTILDPYLKFVKVLALTTDTGRDFVAENVYKEDYEDGLIDTITVLANEDQAVRIAEMDEMAVIHCALVYREGQKNISNYISYGQYKPQTIRHSAQSRSSRHASRNTRQWSGCRCRAPVLRNRPALRVKVHLALTGIAHAEHDLRPVDALVKP